MILIERLTPKGRLLGFDCEGNLVARECTKCCEFLPKKEYSSHKGTNLGINTSCIACNALPDVKHKNNKKTRERRKKDPIKYLLKKRNYSQKNKEKIRASDSIWKNKNREKVRDASNKWKHKNRDHVLNYNKKREMKVKGCKINLPDEQNQLIKSFYSTCKKLNKDNPDSFHVDHIIPISGDNVCGLHVPWNLQILTKAENSSKKNKFDGTYENNSWKKPL